MSKSKWIVAKFGGSSVKDGTAMLRCSQILENNRDIKLTIISATYNTTNQLEMVAKASASGDDEILSKVISEIESKHEAIARELFSSTTVYSELSILNQEMKDLSSKIKEMGTITPNNMDQLYSLGERMSSLIFSDLLRLRMPKTKIVFFDARRVLKTSSEFGKAEPQVELIAELVQKEFSGPLLDSNDEDVLIVTQGFIGSDLLGQTTTLGREGSDYSAALFGEALNVGLIQIWTDVEGVASADPRIVTNTKYISALSYDEATALATLGAKVLFPRTLLPAKRKNIPVFVGSSINPASKGTLISNEMQAASVLKAVTVETIGSEHFISFVGSHLEKIPDLATNLKSLLNKQDGNFIFQDLTSVSITFKFNTLSNQEAMRLGHLIITSNS